MPTLSMNELALAQVANVEAFERGQSLRRDASICNIASEVGHVAGKRRVLRVMHVDDQQPMAQPIIRLVRRWGHAACVAHDRLSAFRLAAARNPDVVLLDMDMPHMDGCQVARQLRLEFLKRDCLIIGVTRRISETRRQHCIEAGIDLLLNKPADPAVVETLLMLEYVREIRTRTNTAPNLSAFAEPAA